MSKLKNKDLISIRDLSQDEVWKILDLARDMETKLKAGTKHPLLEGKTLAMIFEKPSNRTRVSFQVGMWQLGGHAINISMQEMQLGKRESVADIAKVLSRYVDGIVVRTFAHANALELAKTATVPVINGLTDMLHPCQALSDLFTILKRKDKLQGVKMVYVGDGNNVCHSLMLAAAKVGMELTVCTPEEYKPKEEIVTQALEEAAQGGGTIKLETDPRLACYGAEIIYTDIWASMGQEEEAAKRKEIFHPYQVNQVLLSCAAPDVLVMHCLPAHRGEEITSEVVDGPNSVVFDQAENRLHVQKAILALLMG